MLADAKNANSTRETTARDDKGGIHLRIYIRLVTDRDTIAQTATVARSKYRLRLHYFFLRARTTDKNNLSETIIILPLEESS